MGAGNVNYLGSLVRHVPPLDRHAAGTVSADCDAFLHVGHVVIIESTRLETMGTRHSQDDVPLNTQNRHHDVQPQELVPFTATIHLE